MQAIDIFLLFSSFFFYACALALLLNWLWVAAGSPSIDENQEKASAHRNKIFSFFGLWVAKKYNEYEDRKRAEIPAQVHAQIELLSPHEARQTLADFIGEEYVKMMPIETIKNNLYPIFLEQSAPLWLNPYSVLSLCLPCTSFWVGLLGWLPLWFCPFVGFWALLGAFFFLPSTIFQIAKIART